MYVCICRKVCVYAQFMQMFSTFSVAVKNFMTLVLLTSNLSESYLSLYIHYTEEM